MDLRPEMSQLSLRSCLNPWKYTWLLFQSQDKLEISFSHRLAVSGASSRRDNELMGRTAYPGWKGSVWHNCSTDATWWLFVYIECKGHTSSSTWIEKLQHGNRSGGHRVHTNHQSHCSHWFCYAIPCTLRAFNLQICISFAILEERANFTQTAPKIRIKPRPLAPRGSCQLHNGVALNSRK